MCKRLMPVIWLSLIAIKLLANPVTANTNIVESEPLDLTVHFHFRNQYYWNNDWGVAREIEALTNVRLTSVTPEVKANTGELFDAMMSKPKLPDIVGGDNLKERFNQYGMDGKLVPLNSLITRFAPNIDRVLTRRPLLKSSITAPDGNIYHIPYIPSGLAGRGYFVRQDWLDTLGLSVPTNVDELYEVLVAFRDQDPNKNGLRDEIPIFNRHPEEIIRLVNLFGARSTGSDKYHDFVLVGGTVVHPYVQGEFRDAIANVAKWYAEGLIDPRAFERGSSARDELLKNNTGGFTHDWFASTAGYNETLGNDIPGFSFLPILPPADINGKVMEEHARAPIKPDGWAITIDNKNPIETIKLFDFYYSELGSIISNFGVKGETYDIYLAEPRFKREVLRNERSVLDQMMDVGAQIPIGFVQDYNYERQWTNRIASRGIDSYMANKVIEEPFPEVTLSVTEKNIVDSLWPNIQSLMVESIKKWITGKSDVQADWPKYIADLDAMGFQQVIEIMNSAYVRQYKN